MQLLAYAFGKTITLIDDNVASAMHVAFTGNNATGIIANLPEVKSFIKTTKTLRLAKRYIS